MLSPTLKTSFTTNGYVIIPNLISSPSQRQSLKNSASSVIQKTRNNQWLKRRTVGRQFPPFDEEGELDVWGVQHIMHPDLGEDGRVFAGWYTCDELVDVAKGLLGCEEGDLQMELFNLLINPTSHAFALRWHRDDVRENATEEEEREALALWHHGVQWNTALYEDSCLYVVPGSHNTPRTPEQRALSNTMEPPKDPMAMPGAIKVTLKPGETVFYNNNILHCATYSPSSQRATLHGCMGDVRGGSTRARNVLQHGLAWMEEDERFRDGLGERGKAMLGRLVEMKHKAGEVEFSQLN